MINLYQSYYDNSQLPNLDSYCTPFDNTANEEPEFREYPLFKKIYEKEKDQDNLWGLLSFRFEEKTLLKPKEFKDWIEQNPGHNVYYIDPFLDVSVSYPNLWVQGDRWHPGLYEYFFRLVGPSARELKYHPDDFVTCNFFVANNSFWQKYFNFVDGVIEKSKNDEKMNYLMFQHKVKYNGKDVPYFSFIIERLLSLYFHFNTDINKLKFPIEHDCFRKKYGEQHNNLINIYKSRL